MIPRSTISIFGYVGSEPEIRSEFLKLSVGVSNKNKDQTSTTTWYDALIPNRLSDSVTKHVSKGDQIYISGDFKLNEYQNKLYPVVYVQNLQFFKKQDTTLNSSEFKADEFKLNDDIPF